MYEDDKDSLLRKAMKRDSKDVRPVKIYACDLCKDSGYIATTADGKEYACTDYEAINYVSIKHCICKKKRDAKESIVRSGLSIEEYESKSFGNFKRDTELAVKMYDMAQQFINDNNAQGIGYFGKSGTGKTHICIAICNQLIEKGISHKYFNYRRDIQELNALRYKPEQYHKKLGDFITTPVLYIDDLFKLARTNKGEMDVYELQIMFDIINTRYINKQKVIISSEYTVAEIKDIDEAIGSRIYHMVSPYGMKCEGKNRRF